MNYTEAMNFISSFTKTGAKAKDLSRAEKLMEKLGNPHMDLKFVHIAGTNGKGSVLELMSQSLINAGYKTGQFTSPFMRVYEDRIRINGINISHDDVAEMCTAVSEAVDDEQYSQFEITMAIALLYFKREKCDIVFLEAGIGGLFDCTNIVENPLVCVITSISLDHTAILGNTVQEIAIQKAGIIKRERPVVVSWNNTAVYSIFEKETIFKNSELIIPEMSEFTDISTDSEGGRFTYNGEEYRLKMHGRHQVINAATAIKAIEVLRNEGYKISTENVKESFSQVQVLSRVEVIKGNPDIIIDGGHNPAGISALLSALTAMEIEKPVVIFGMVDTKDAETCAMLISTYAGMVICVDGFASNSVDKSKLASYIKCEKLAANISESLILAKMNARKNNASVVICGSLYMTEMFREML